ncbi:uncharacterized protein EKO05_0005230 [Ascochyta rabiei]|nr:uncharacterized protein EKO05_0005230 [Ascochyta rabiei]UPX14758.1 hypothetical protein EKO05_0005230 [Ascochyta rabiei]
MNISHLQANHIKRETSPPKSLKPEPAHDDGVVKGEPDGFVPKSEFDDGGESSSEDGELDDVPVPLVAPLAAPFAVPLAAPLESFHVAHFAAPFVAPLAALLTAPVPAQAKVIQDLPGIEDTPAMVTVLSKRMNKIHDLTERERACRAGIEGIGMEVGDLKRRALELLNTGQTNWLFSRIGSLSGQKAIIQMILTKIEQRKLRRQAKLRRREQEKQRQKQREAELKIQLEVKRQSNKQQLQAQSALKMQVPLLDLTAAPKPDIKREARAVVKIEPEIKIESYIKIEED